MSIDLVRLRRFLAVYRHENFSRAADELAMTHSALTKSVQQLESELGVALFDRTTRSVIPTAAGHRLASRADELLAFSDQLRDEVSSGQRHIRLITGPAVIEASLGPALVRFHRSHPDVQVTAETMPPDIALARLQRREANALLYHETSLGALPDKRTLKISPIIDEPYVAVMRRGHPALAGGSELVDLLTHQWAVPGFDRVYRTGIAPDLAESYRQAGFPHFRVLSLGTCLSMAAESDLLALLPRGFAERHCAANGLAIMDMPAADAARYRVSAAMLANAPQDEVLDSLISEFTAEQAAV